jgi:hypothetical protein
MYRVWFIRYGVQHYYLADTLGEAQRFVRVYQAIGGIELQYIELPDGTKIDV